MPILQTWLRELSTTFLLITLLDLAIVGFILYRLFIIIRGTRAVQLLKGLAVLVIANLISQWAGLNITSWIFSQALTIGIIALPIIFYPELRRALEQLGRGRIFPKVTMLGPQERAQAVESVVKAVFALARRRVGALIVWEQETGLKDWAETGVPMDSQLSSELIVNIFEPNAPLHDGAVIIRGNRIQAASCYLPLSDNPDLRADLGTRHRAALGITEHSDAVAVVVSEETGAISIAIGGEINRYLDEKTLREQLDQYLKARQQEHALFTKRWQPHWKE
jgi:diadenylate cyclase